MIVLILSALVIGIGMAFFNLTPPGLINYIDSILRFLLIILLFLVGIDIGTNKKAIFGLKKMGFRILLIPAVIIAGSLTGGLLLSFFINFSIFKSLAIASGMGYYTLSSIILTQMVGSELGTMAFLSNIIREILTIIITPFISKKSQLSPIAAGGATSMDTTLPVIVRFTSKTVGLISIISGVIITFLVPLLVTFFAGLI
ncbi:MAG TPA: lysine exporter LysO family protein [Candidatus Humimicrobiaceae bacterium]|nr:lysine exporter LysO family protein [Candidatus Humimicrobiaceae bacterium]